MKVSIIVPVYNIAPYIERCLDAVGAQTYRGDLECVLVDDCGSDESMEVVWQWTERYKGTVCFRIVRHETNKGLGAARNTGIMAARGEYVYFMDGDDAITADCIETLVLLADKYPDAEMILGNTMAGEGCHATHRFRREAPEYCNDKQVLEEYLLEYTISTAWNRMLKRSWIVGNGLLFPESHVIEDRPWVYVLSRKMTAAAFCNRGTYCYYVHDNSITTSVSEMACQKRLKGFLITSETIFNDIKAQGYPPTRCQKQYLAEGFVGYMMNIPSCSSLAQWCILWRTVLKMRKVLFARSRHGVALFFAMMPPFCFLVKVKAWRWRLRHYVVGRL